MLAGACENRFLRKAGNCSTSSPAVMLDVLVQILDDELAAKLARRKN